MEGAEKRGGREWKGRRQTMEERKEGRDGWMDGGGEGGRKRKGGKEKKDERDGGRDGRGGMGSDGKEDHKIGWVLPC